jgi:hypothetical protein
MDNIASPSISPDNRAIGLSWVRISSYSEQIFQAINGCRLHEALALIKRREHSIERHFFSHPIGPETADFYRHRINAFLQAEKKINCEMVKLRRQSFQLVR